MILQTHLKIDERLSGEVVLLKNDFAKVVLETTQEMVADNYGLVHGGFIFSAADYAAMAAINHPNVVLAKSEVKFLAPTKLGDSVILEAKVSSKDGIKASVEVVGKIEEKEVFKGTFFTATLENHILA